MSVSRQILLSILVVLLAAGGWYAIEHRDELFGGVTAATSGESPAVGGDRGGSGRSARGGGDVPVITARVGVDDAGEQIRAIGTLKAARAVTLYPEVTGIVEAVDVAPGATVTQGEVLIRLNSDDQEIAIDRATIALDDARAALDRAERLAKSNNVTEVALSDVRTRMRSAEIDLKSAEIDRAKRVISAPFAGNVGLVPISVGDLVTTSTALTTLDDVSSLTAEFVSPERFAGKIKIGHPVSGEAIGLSGREIKGAVSAVDSRVDPNTRVFKLEATLEQGIDSLKPGMSITVSIDFAGEPQATVPSLAIQWDRQGSYVWTLDGDAAKRTSVQIVGRRSGLVIVAGEIEKGAEVVVEGLQRMREGIAVKRVGGEPGKKEEESVSSYGEDRQDSHAAATRLPDRAG